MSNLFPLPGGLGRSWKQIGHFVLGRLEMISSGRPRVQYPVMKLRTSPVGMAALAAGLACSSGATGTGPAEPRPIACDYEGCPSETPAAAPASPPGAGQAATTPAP